MASKLSAVTCKPRSVVSRRSVRVRAESEARKWINNWAAKQSASASRPSWYPGSDLPTYLDGTLPGDYGFDPLGLGSDAGKLSWYVQAELVHCRFAMLGVAGVLVPELASKIGISWPGANVAWFDAGKFDYFAPAGTLFAIQMFFFGWAEIRRLQDIRKPGSVNQDPLFSQYSLPAGEVGYPGGIFDPFGWSKSADLPTLKKKEIANGRLAMAAFAGFAAQAYTTGGTPLENLATHLANPGYTTVWSNDLARL